MTEHYPERGTGSIATRIIFTRITRTAAFGRMRG